MSPGQLSDYDGTVCVHGIGDTASGELDHRSALPAECTSAAAADHDLSIGTDVRDITGIDG